MNQGFSIDKYRKRSEGQKEESALPDWLDKAKPKLVALVKAINEEFLRVKLLISQSPKNLPVSQRRIKGATVCKMAGVVPSYLRLDRKDTRRIHQYLAHHNENLNELWLNSQRLQNNSGRTLLKADLLGENRLLKQQLEKKGDEKAREYFTLWVEENVVSDQKRLRAKISDLEAKIAELEEENSSLKLDLAEVRERALKPFK